MMIFSLQVSSKVIIALMLLSYEFISYATILITFHLQPQGFNISVKIYYIICKISSSDCQTNLFQKERTHNIAEWYIPRYCFFLVRDNNICIFDCLVLQAIQEIRAKLKFFVWDHIREHTNNSQALDDNHKLLPIVYQYNKKQKQIDCDSLIVIFE